MRVNVAPVPQISWCTTQHSDKPSSLSQQPGLFTVRCTFLDIRHGGRDFKSIRHLDDSLFLCFILLQHVQCSLPPPPQGICLPGQVWLLHVNQLFKTIIVYIWLDFMLIRRTCFWWLNLLYWLFLVLFQSTLWPHVRHVYAYTDSLSVLIFNRCFPSWLRLFTIQYLLNVQNDLWIVSF